MPSPAPKPAGLKLLEGRGNGRDSGGRKVKTPPAFRRLAPVMPADLSPLAVAWWAEHVPEMVRLDLVKAADAPALAMAGEAWATWSQAMEIVRREGLLMDGKQGLVSHPALRVAESAARDYRAWCSEFGLTPSAEMKVAKATVPSAEEEPNPFLR